MSKRVSSYEDTLLEPLEAWVKKMRASPSWISRLQSKIQNRINGVIPEKLHQAITATMRELIKGVVFGSKFTTRSPKDLNLQAADTQAVRLIERYKSTAAAEGGITGAGGFLASLADFPILLGIKIKMLFALAAVYGYDTKELQERIFILYIFQLAFSSQQVRRQTFELVANFERDRKLLPQHINELDWRTLQQQYRDYIDVAKLAQMIPMVGAVVGFIANLKLVAKLGHTAQMCYRLRRLQAPPLSLAKEDSALTKI